MKDNFNDRFDEKRQIDELFLQGLEDLRPDPPKDLWKVISRKLLWKEISYCNFTNLSRIVWIGSSVVAILIATGVYLSLTIDPSIPSVTSVIQPMPHETLVRNAMNPAVSNDPLTNAPLSGGIKSKNQPLKEPSNSSITASTVKSNKQPVTNTVYGKHSKTGNLAASQLNLASSTGLSRNETILNLESMSPDDNEIPYINPVDVQSLFPGDKNDTLRIIAPGIVMNVPKEEPPVPKFFSTELSITPEVIFYRSPAAYTEMNFFGDLGITFHISRFSIRSGIGLGYIFDDGEYRIQYKSKDSVGYYNNVVSYSVNPINPQDITYNIERIAVFDSIQHVADDNARFRYTYFQVPLLLGYRFFETNQLGLTIETGPAVSILSGTKEALPVINYPNARIIRIDNNTPSRIKINWQLWLGLRLDYRMGKNFNLFAEPSFKYYLKPVIEQGEENGKNPVSVGLGIGIQYNFGRIK